MRSIKFKRFYLPMLSMFIFTMLITSCEKEINNNAELNEVIEPPLTLEELDAIWGEQPNGENIESRTNCKCESVYASRRTLTTSYVYCKKWHVDSPGPVTYVLTGYEPGNQYSDNIHITNYWSVFGGFEPGVEYILEIFLPCNGGVWFKSKGYKFTQSDNYPPPDVY